MNTVLRQTFALFALAALASAAAADPAIPLLKSSDVQEKIDAVVPIAGDGIVGAVMLGPDDHVDPDALFVRFRSPASGKEVNIYLSSPDSRYSASWKIDVPKGFTGWARIEYGGTAQKVLKTYKVYEMATLASDGTSVFPVRWSNAADTDSMLVLINSERANAFTIRKNAKGSSKVECSSIDTKQTLRYDKICQIDLKTSVRTDNGFEIRRRRGGTVLSPLRLRIDD